MDARTPYRDLRKKRDALRLRDKRRQSRLASTPSPQSDYPDPPAKPPIEPNYTIPLSHLLDPAYSGMTDPPLWSYLNGGGGGGTSNALPISGGTMTGPLILASDPTTSLQAATKQYVDAHAGSGGAMFTLFSAFGGVGDGVTDNSSAWNSFATFARSESTAGRAVNLFIAPGTYNYDHSKCQGFLQNITQLYILGYGVTIQNTYNRNISGANASNEWPWGVACQTLRNATGTLLGFLLQTTVADGTTNTVTLVTATDYANFAVGDWIMLASLDIQYYGFPGNTDQFEFAQITAINSSTGVITIDRPVRYIHRSDFPDGGNATPCGKARIWQLNTGGWPVGKVTWNIDHTYEGLTVLPAPNAGSLYQIFTGRRIKTINWSGVGPSESVASFIEHLSPKFTTQGEPDKLVSSILYQNMAWDIGQRLAFQSSSIDRVRIVDSVINGELTTGAAKHVTIENCDIENLAMFGGTYGLPRSLTIRNSRVYFANWINNDLNGYLPSLTVDGANVTFADGTFAILKSFSSLPNWNAIVGQFVNIAANINSNLKAAYSGDIGTGIIVRLREDATHLYIDTTLPFATLPTWAAGSVRFINQGEVWVENCTGSDSVRCASEARKAGKNARNFYRYRFFGAYSRSGGWYNHAGSLITVKVNIHTVFAGGGVFQLTVGTANATTMADTGNLVLNFSSSTAGLRTITQSAATLLSGDSMTLNSVAITQLPTNTIISGATDLYLGYDPSTVPIYQSPIVDLSLELDDSLITISTTSKFDTISSTPQVIAGAIGNLP